MSKKAWIIFVGICVALLVTLVAMSNKEKLDVSSVDVNAIQAATPQSGDIGEHVFGNKDSKVVMIEYGDFQCNPGCKTLHENYAPIMDEYKDSVAFVYRNFPITSIHPNTLAASATAEAAGLQGEYWKMWNLLFEKQAEWSSASPDQRTALFESYAKDLKLNMDSYQEALRNPSLTKKISFDQALGQQDGVTGTPTLLINGVKLDGEKYMSTEALKKTLDEAIKNNK